MVDQHPFYFQRESNGATAGYGARREVLDKVGTFVRKPLAESCIDRKTFGMEHMVHFTPEL